MALNVGFIYLDIHVFIMMIYDWYFVEQDLFIINVVYEKNMKNKKKHTVYDNNMLECISYTKKVQLYTWSVSVFNRSLMNIYLCKTGCVSQLSNSTMFLFITLKLKYWFFLPPINKGCTCYPFANEVAKGYSNATVRPSFLPSVCPSYLP